MLHQVANKRLFATWLHLFQTKNDGQRAPSDQEMDEQSWHAEMKVQHHMYAVFKCIAFQFP